ncbi:hypothetical protein PspLS_09671, partial [Pyricularia sp. CBS 133598]
SCATRSGSSHPSLSLGNIVLGKIHPSLSFDNSSSGL